MSITTVMTTIQTFNKTITGVVTAPATPPGQPLNTADLPEVIVLAGPSQWLSDSFGNAGDEDRRTYIVRVYVKPVADDKAGQGYIDALVLLERFKTKYLADRTLGGSVFHAWTMADSGVQGDLAWDMVAYHGFTLTISAQVWA